MSGREAAPDVFSGRNAEKRFVVIGKLGAAYVAHAVGGPRNRLTAARELALRFVQPQDFLVLNRRKSGECFEVPVQCRRRHTAFFRQDFDRDVLTE